MAIEATFSPCGTFRYLLVDVWDEKRPVLPWMLFNPSRAGRVVNGKVISDPTARKGRGFSERWGYGGMAFVNPYAFVSPEPSGLRAAGYPVGPENDAYILKACAMGPGIVVCGWGDLGRGLARPRAVLQMVRAAGYRPMALGFTSAGEPRHPARLGYDTALVEMRS